MGNVPAAVAEGARRATGATAALSAMEHPSPISILSRLAGRTRSISPAPGSAPPRAGRGPSVQAPVPPKMVVVYDRYSRADGCPSFGGCLRRCLTSAPAAGIASPQSRVRQNMNRLHISERPSPSRVVKQAPPRALRVRELRHPEPVQADAGVNSPPSRERADRPQVLAASVVGGESWGTRRSRKGKAARRRPLRFWLPGQDSNLQPSS